MSDLVLSRAKAVIAAVVVAILGAIAGIDWGAVVLAALGTGGAVERTPNKKR
jgi:hypothetical protein